MYKMFRLMPHVQYVNQTRANNCRARLLPGSRGIRDWDIEMEDEAVLWDSELEDFLEQAGPAQPPPVCIMSTQSPPDSPTLAHDGNTHLLLGDSIARDAPVCISPPDLLLRLEKGGHTWARLAMEVEDDIELWRRAACDYGRPVGRAVIWMTGNDVYPRRGTRIAGLNLEELRKNASVVVDSLQTVASEVIILGPLPRFKFDDGKTWTQTPAFLAERCLKHMFSENPRVSVENLGRALTATRGKCKAVTPVVAGNFSLDGIHLSPRGYAKVLDKMPSWMTRSGEEE